MNGQKQPRIYRFWRALTIPALVIIAILTIDVLLHPLQPESYYNSVAYRLVVGLIAVPLTVTIGLLCMRYSPGNVLGPVLIFLAAGSAAGLIRSDTDPLFHVIAAGWGIAVYWCCILLFLLYFPDGKPHFRRMGKWVGRMTVPIFAVIFFFNFVTTPTVSYGTISATMPLYIPALKPLSDALQASIFPIWGTAYLLFVLVSLIARYRSGQRRERQQLKWLLWSLSIWLVPQLILPVFSPPEWFARAVNTFSILFSSVLPLTVGVSIVRYRLWDIDIIIRRTLVYSILTAALAVLYFGGVVIAQQIIRALTGQTSDLAIVLSTLAIAALVNPLRHRIQNTIDRRFFRRKYNAQMTLEAFSVATRDEVDLDKLQAALLGLVQETMQPTKIGLWLRESENSFKSDRAP